MICQERTICQERIWEERKIQEKIGRWVKREKEKGKSVKVGFKWIEGKWKRWEEIEKKEMESKK